MVKFKHLAAIAILSTVIANPVLAQTVIQEPSAYAKNYPVADLGVGSQRSSRAAISTRSARTTVWPALSATASRVCPTFFRQRLRQMLC
jgi:hypothetical protein